MDNQNALDQHRTILLAIIDYFFEAAAARVIVDGVDSFGNHFQKLRERGEKHYRNGNLKLLQRVIKEISDGQQLMKRDGYITFMQERTGYDAELLKQIIPREPAKRKGVLIEEGLASERPKEIFSPDNKRKIIFSETNRPGRPVMTQVAIFFGGSGASVYMVEGVNLGINVYWKDNNTIVIETRAAYVAILKPAEQYQSLDDVVKVEMLCVEF